MDLVAEPVTGHVVYHLGVMELDLEHGKGPGLHLEERQGLISVLRTGSEDRIILMPWSGHAHYLNRIRGQMVPNLLEFRLSWTFDLVSS